MAKVYTSSDLIDSVKVRGMIPENEKTFETEDFLNFLNEEMEMYILPYLMSVHEEYNVVSEDQDIVGTQTVYPIPYRAIGNKLRGLFYVDADGNEIRLPRISIEDKDDYYTNGVNFYGRHNAFYVQNNNIVLIDEPNTDTGSIRMYFYLRCNTLVENDSAGLITAIDANTGVITMSNFPTDFATLPLMDFVGKKSPNKIKGYDIQPSAVNSTTKTITFTAADLPDDLAVGDYINLAEESIVPQLPTELHPLLAQKVALTCMEALGDEVMVKSIRKKMIEMEKKLFNIIDNRVESSTQKVKNRNSSLRVAINRSGNRYGW
jgi:hypothetical protein